MADKIEKAITKFTVNGTTSPEGLLNLSDTVGPDYLPVYCAGRTAGQAVVATIFDSTHESYVPYIRILDYNGNIVANKAITVLVYCIHMGGVIPQLLLALSGAGVRHERQTDSTKYTNRAYTRNKFCLRRREVHRCNFPQKFARSKSSLHSYLPKWVGRIRFGTSHISSGYKFYLLCKEQFIFIVGDWLRLDSCWIDGLAVKAA